jgi:hypothetical protein
VFGSGGVLGAVANHFQTGGAAKAPQLPHDVRQPGPNPWTQNVPPPNAPPQPPAAQTQQQPAPEAPVAPVASQDAVAKLAPVAGAIAAGGAAAVANQMNNAPPPHGFEGYWRELSWESKALAIAGLSITAISAFRAMFPGEEEKGTGSFLQKILPLLGVGAAAYGLGGGTMGIDNKLQLPTGAKYRQLGNAATTNLGFGPQF